MANKSFVDSVGNWVNLEACQKFPSQQTVIPGATTPAPNVLVKTRLGNFFEVSKGPNGKAQYNPLGPAEVEAFCGNQQLQGRAGDRGPHRSECGNGAWPWHRW